MSLSLANSLNTPWRASTSHEHLSSAAIISSALLGIVLFLVAFNTVFQDNSLNEAIGSGRRVNVVKNDRHTVCGRSLAFKLPGQDNEGDVGYAALLHFDSNAHQLRLRFRLE